MFQPPPEGHAAAEAGHAAAEGAAETFNAGEVIIDHVSNSSLEHPLIHLPTVSGVDLSVTKHVFMLWLVAALLFVGITWIVRRYIRQERLIPTGFMGVLEIAVEFIRDSIAAPNFGRKWSGVWTPLLLTLFFFILGANLIGLIPIFDVLSLLNHTVIHAPEDSFFPRDAPRRRDGDRQLQRHGRARHGDVCGDHRRRLARSRVRQALEEPRARGLALPLQIALIPIEIMGMLVRPFALTMRLAANMTGGHIAILAILSFVFIFNQMMGALGGHRRRACCSRCRWRSPSPVSKSSSSWSRRTCSRS
jgi:F-type H+-transporting ATPase subunit a